jgi:EpsI family protein
MAKRQEILHTGVGDLPLRRMETKGLWAEPVTYWFTVGQYAVNNEWDRKEAKLRYAAKGEIPDGLLVRVSSRDADTAQAYRLQGKFIEDLLKSVPPDARRRLAGL